MNEAKKQSGSTERVSLPEILDNPTVNDTFVRMFEIGLKQYHESAFAVYRDAVGDNFVSELLIPTSPQGGDYDTQMEKATSIDVGDLIIDQDKELVIKPSAEYPFAMSEYNNDLRVLPYNHLTDMQRAQIEKILISTKMDEAQKIAYVNGLIRRRRAEREIEESKADIRNDISFLVHNHPQYPFMKQDAHKVVVPSYEDITLANEVRVANPSMISGVVASDGERHLLALYGYSPAMSRLAIAPIVYLDLDDKGKVAHSSLAALKDFSASK